MCWATLPTAIRKLIRAIGEAGHEIGVHGYYHRFIYKLSPDEFRGELGQAIEAVERAAGVMLRRDTGSPISR